MQLQEKKSPILDNDFPAPDTGVPSPCSDRGSILDRVLPASVGLHWNCGEPSHSCIRSTRKQVGVGLHKKLRALTQTQKKLDMKEMSLVQRFLERQQTSVEPERLDNSPMVDSISQEDQSQAPQSYYVEKTIIQRV